MSERLAEWVTRVRGSLPLRGLGARGLEAAARNPACLRLQILTLTGVRPAVALTETYGEQSKEGQSPFAIGTGKRFEQRLFADGAARLLQAYQEGGRLEPRENRVVNVAELAPGAKPADLQRRREITRELLVRQLAGDPTAPHLIVKPRLLVKVAGGLRYDIEPDALVAGDGDPGYRPIEIKSYPDRGGKTNPADIRAACRQAAVEVIALRQTLARLATPGPESRVPDRADIMLRRPGTMRPALRSMAISGEVHSIERFLAAAEERLEDLLRLVPPGGTLADQAVLDSIPNAYRETCREHCALASRCKRQALAQGDLILFGGRFREDLAAAGSIVRVFELIDGRGEPPRTPEERELGERLLEARAAYQTAVAHAV